MEAAPIHKIRRQIFNVKHHGRANAFALQTSAEEFCKNVLLPKIEALLSQYNDVQEQVSINTVKIDVSSRSITEFNVGLANKIVNELEQSIVDKLNGLDEIRSISAHEDDVNSQLVFFLKSGYLKKTKLAKTIDLREIVALWLQQKDAKDVLIKAIQFKPAAERLSILLDEKQWWDLIEQSSLLSSSVVQSLKEDISLLKHVLGEDSYQQLFSNFKVAFLQFILLSENKEWLIERGQSLLIKSGVLDKVQSKDVLLKSFKTIFVNQKVNIERFDVVAEEAFEQKDLNEIYVANAGLVLVATYLPLFFNNLGIELNGNLKHEARALALLHYLATGTEQAEEWQLVLPKLFIGIPLPKFVPLEYMLTQDDKAKANELLEAIITNWTVLKSTTVNGLRQTFIQRSGTLSFRDDKWYLFIEPESFDLLLDHLPWQISMIKLPWMKHLLQVQWR